MNDNFYTDYFTGLAVSSTDIHHDDSANKAFYVIDDVENMREVQEAIRRLASQFLLLEEFEDDLNDNDSDSGKQMLHGAFAIMIRASAKDALSIRTAKEAARAIARKFVFKMRRDSISGALEEQGITCKIDAKGFGVGPVADNCYGWRYSFTWYAFLPSDTDPADWS